MWEQYRDSEVIVIIRRIQTELQSWSGSKLNFNVWRVYYKTGLRVFFDVQIWISPGFYFDGRIRVNTNRIRHHDLIFSDNKSIKEKKKIYHVGSGSIFFRGSDPYLDSIQLHFNNKQLIHYAHLYRRTFVL